MSTIPEAGQPAPAFKERTGNGSELSLADFKGSWLLLYFYPEDNTLLCTRQACNLRDNFSELTKAGIKVVGVSDDDEQSHERFADRYELPFPLLADTERKVMKAYGTYGEKNLYGRLVTGVKRTSFLIDPDGIIRHVFKRPNTSKHSEEVFSKFQALTN